MAITIELPHGMEERLREDAIDPDAIAKEALLVELYRRGKISHGALAEGLGLSRYEVDAMLTRYRVTEDLLTSEELADQVASLRRLIGQ